MGNIKKKITKFIKYFDLLIKKTLLKYKYLILTGNTQKKITRFIKYFDFLIKTTLFKSKNEKNNIFPNKISFKISNFNKYLISSIICLFFYLFYLSIPTLYDKAWVQNTIESKLLNEFKINFSVSSEISYEILPSPHFTIKNSKIINDDENSKQLSDIKDLKIFISTKNLFNKDKLLIKKIIINKANFTLQKGDFKFFNNLISEKLSHKKIFIKKSNIFFEDTQGEIVTIIQLPKVILFYDEIKYLNNIFLEGEVFKIPFNLKLDKEIFSELLTTKTKITSKKIKIKISNESTKDKNYNDSSNSKGSNKLFILNSKLITNYKLQRNLLSFDSKESQLNNSKLNYTGNLNLNPFYLNLNINLEKMKLNNFFNPNSILLDLFKTKLLFNENISSNVSININKIPGNKLFDSAKIILNINNGAINFNETILNNKKIGSLEVASSKLYFENDNLILSNDLIFNLKNSNDFYSFLLTPKKLRRPIENIFIKYEYNFFKDKIIIKDFKIDDNNLTDSNKNVLNDFNNSKINSLENLILNRNLFNKLLNY